MREKHATVTHARNKECQVGWTNSLPLCSLSHKFLFPESVQSRKGKEKSPFSLTRLAWCQCNLWMDALTQKQHAHHRVQKKGKLEAKAKWQEQGKKKTKEWKDAQTKPLLLRSRHPHKLHNIVQSPCWVVELATPPHRICGSHDTLGQPAKCVGWHPNVLCAPQCCSISLILRTLVHRYIYTCVWIYIYMYIYLYIYYTSALTRHAFTGLARHQRPYGCTHKHTLSHPCVLCTRDDKHVTEC